MNSGILLDRNVSGLSLRLITVVLTVSLSSTMLPIAVSSYSSTSRMELTKRHLLKRQAVVARDRPIRS
jgi:hypothetical protein